MECPTYDLGVAMVAARMMIAGDSIKRKHKREHLVAGVLLGTGATVALISATYQVQCDSPWLLGTVIASVTVIAAVFLVLRQHLGRRLIGRKEMKGAELAHLSRLVMAGEVSASIIHEIAHSLSSILINIAAMELSLINEDKLSLVAIIADLKLDQNRANQVVQRMRAFLSRRELTLERTDMNETINCILELLKVDLKKRDVAVKVKLTSDLPEVFADPIHLQQVLLNLFTNAMDAMADIPRESRVLEVTTHCRGDGQAEVVITDSGVGMTRGQLEHAFDMFFTTKRTGMGLGLSITRWIVQAHHGAIWAEQHSSGGTSFHITIPLALRN